MENLKCEFNSCRTRRLIAQMPHASQVTLEAWKAMYFRSISEANEAYIVDHHSWKGNRVAYYVHSVGEHGRPEMGWVFAFQAEAECGRELRRYERVLTDLPNEYEQKTGRI